MKFLQKIKEYKQNNPILFWIILIATITGYIALFFISIFIGAFHYPSTDIKDWTAFSAYFSGTVGTICSIGVFIATLCMIYTQQQEARKQSKIFNQQQFDTIFLSLIKSICEEQSKSKPCIPVIYGLVIKSKEFTENYKCKLENDKTIDDEICHYVDILKIRIRYSTLSKLLDKIMRDNDKKLKDFFISYSFASFLDMEGLKYEDIKKYKEYFTDKLFGKENISYLRMIAKLEDLDENTVKELYETGDFEILVYLAKNTSPGMTMDILKALSNDKDDYVRLSVATREQLPNELIIKLAEDENIEVRKGIIQRSDCPMEIKIKILEKSNYDDDFCKLIVNDDRTSVTILNKILDKYELIYIKEIVQHKNANKEIFEKIIDILDKKLISDYITKNNECILNEWHDYKNMPLLFDLLKVKKLYEYKELVKKCLHLYADKYNLAGYVTKNGIVINLNYDTVPDNEREFVLDILLEYIQNIDSNGRILNSIREFIEYSQNKLKDKERIKEKINKIEKLNTKQKDALIKALSL